MVTYHQGNKKRIESDTRNYYMFRDIISKNYDKAGPQERESILENFNQIHIRMCKKIGRKVIDEEDARDALQKYFSEMPERQLRAIFDNILGPKPKKQRLKERARDISEQRRPIEPYCKAEQFELFGE